ncbi:hypothetical protein OGAPHI_007464 [Ogataea philodendri]|uniref:SH3 domain-containing protein n=1 Tax=Ogataea philodendri TaxID=1378263 RepID=A0A9P8SZM5_9ASCO|nr:uncharacterized protein OGAPHI_007464 [Ogataea philodendri]KAH3660259.1 hypothetical protein OGAPHI_007464 [Ogataea philodendri]
MINRFNSSEKISDPEFDRIVMQIKGLDKLFETFESSLQKHRISISRLLSHSIAIGVCMRELSDPSHLEGGIVTQQQTKMFENASKYVDQYESVQPAIEEENRLFEERVGGHLKKVSKQIKVANKAIKERNYASMDYEKYQMDLKKLSEKPDLSLKEHKRKFEVTKKLDEAKTKYELLNTKLKMELPLFMLIIRQIMSQIFVMTYFATYSIFYNLYNSCAAISQEFNIDIEGLQYDTDFVAMRAEFEKNQKHAVDTLDQLSVVNFHQITLNKLQLKVLETTAPSELCVAMYDFHGSQAEDLSFREGDRIKILEKNESGWWNGMKLKDGSVGIFPYNYVNLI